jgi:hypothetical protein
MGREVAESAHPGGKGGWHQRRQAPFRTPTGELPDPVAWRQQAASTYQAEVHRCGCCILARCGKRGVAGR